MNQTKKNNIVTDDDCEYWDNYYTNNNFEPGPNLLKQGVKPGFIHKFLALSELDQEVAEYLYTQAKMHHKSNAEVINDLVHEKLSMSI